MERSGFLYFAHRDRGLDPVSKRSEGLDNSSVGTSCQNLAANANDCKEPKLASCTDLATQRYASDFEATVPHDVFSLYGRHHLDFSLRRNVP